MLNMLKYFIICKTELHLHLTKYLRYQFSSTLTHICKCELECKSSGLSGFVHAGKDKSILQTETIKHQKELSIKADKVRFNTDRMDI